MKVNQRKTIFICQVSGHSLKIIRCLKGKDFFRVFEAESQDIPAGANEASISAQLSPLFKKSGYKNNPLIISLPHNYATCRYLRLPAESEEEIESMLPLQLAKYLPCPASDLVMGYQILSTDKEGYSDINTVIVPKDAIESTMKIFREFNSRPDILLSSYGLVSLYNYLELRETGPLMLVDIDNEHVELVIVENRKAIFSRAFRLNQGQDSRETIFIEQVNKTQNTYLRETQRRPVEKIVVLGSERATAGFVQTLKENQRIPVENIPFAEKLRLPRESAEFLLNASGSFASLIGLAIEDQNDTLHLLPQPLRDKRRESFQALSLLRFLALFSITALAFSLATAKNLDNKAVYLDRLNQELEKLGKEAQPLEAIRERLLVIKNQSFKRTSVLDVLIELYKITPEEIGLLNLVYEEAGSLTLKGQAPQLNSVFNFIELMEKSEVFKGYNVKVKYAASKKSGPEDTVDFEIACVKKEI